ncbi:MAG: FecR domain-containing protein [Deltaproteobacteria bacterium]
MSRCPRTTEAARFEFLAKEERASFTRHAGKCVECERAFEVLHDARTTLRENVREPDADQLRALRLGVDAKVSRRRPTWIAWPVAAAAVALCAALILWSSSPVVQGRVLHAGVAVEGALPLRAELVADAGTKLAFADAALTAPEGATFAVDLDTRSEVRVLRGTMRFDVAPRDDGFWVSTPHTTIRVVGTRFTVRVLAARTELSVEEGVVEAAEGTQLHRVTAQQSIRVPRDVARESDAASAGRGDDGTTTARSEGADPAGARAYDDVDDGAAMNASARHERTGDVDGAPASRGASAARSADGASASRGVSAARDVDGARASDEARASSSDARFGREASAARASDGALAEARTADDGTRAERPPVGARSSRRAARDESTARSADGVRGDDARDDATARSADGASGDDARDESTARSADGASGDDARDDATARSADGASGDGARGDATARSADGASGDDDRGDATARSADGASGDDARDDAPARSAEGARGDGARGDATARTGGGASRDARSADGESAEDAARADRNDAPSTDAPPRTPRAWLARGDDRRRANDFAGAADAYANAATSPALAEEALWRRAEMLGANGDLDAALALLASSQRRFAAGRLGPERAVLTAQLAVEAGRFAFAVQTLEAAGTSSFAVRSARLTIGARLVNEDAALARRVVAPLLGPSQARSIRIRAHVVAIRAAHEARDVDDETALREALEKIEADE